MDNMELICKTMLEINESRLQYYYFADIMTTIVLLVMCYTASFVIIKLTNTLR